MRVYCERERKTYNVYGTVWKRVWFHREPYFVVYDYAEKCFALIPVAICEPEE